MLTSSVSKVSSSRKTYFETVISIDLVFLVILILFWRMILIYLSAHKKQMTPNIVIVINILEFPLFIIYVGTDVGDLDVNGIVYVGNCVGCNDNDCIDGFNVGSDVGCNIHI